MNNGNVVQMRNDLHPDRTQNFAYDALNRIRRAWTEGALWGNVYDIDAWGNLQKVAPMQGQPQGEYMDDLATGKNQLLQHQYDAAGNMVEASAYAYDAEGRLSSAAGVVYSYDGDGRRVKKSTGTLYWTGTGTEALFETDANGTWTEEYVLFGGRRVAQRSSTGAVKYYLGDHLGSTRVVVSGTGQVLQDMDYFPYGRVASGASETKYLFTGKERDAESGLDYFGARYYGSTMGRFLSPDDFTGGPVDVFSPADPNPPGPLPYADITNPQSLNKYSYTYNNPLRYTDPDGHDIWDVLFGIVNATASNFAGVQRFESGNEDFRAGQVIGDVASVVAGTVGAIGGAAAGTTLDIATGGAALVAAPAQVAAVAIPANGAVNGAISLYRTAIGGTYMLTNPNTGEVQRTGRTNNLDRRQKEHARDPQTKDLKFNVDKRTDNAAARRGREQIIHDKYKPPMNKVNPVNPKNPNKAKYLKEAEKLAD